jgi:FAD/FMN-containing dehydrogenase
MQQPVSSWGRLSAEQHHVVKLRDRLSIEQLLAKHQPGIAYGMGRSYGDVCLNPQGALWQTSALDRFIQFDEVTGRLICEAGVLLKDIQRLFVPQGWMLPVTPGTQMVTVGGAIANDVHGKNHHGQGSFGHHVRHIKLLRTSGELLECHPGHLTDWFAATVGGMGLTGLILEAEIQLRRIPSPWLLAETISYANLNEFFKLTDESSTEWEHTVSWIDCLSKTNHRGLFMRARAIDVEQGPQAKTRQITFPLIMPFSLVNRWSLRPFNAAYYHVHARKAGSKVVHYEPFFYPLDNLLEWNRMYGRRGFYQYQSVVPCDVGYDVTRAMLQEISRAKDGSFLAVLKTFGPHESKGLMSFPMPGVTLALDFPNKNQRTIKLFKRLDAIVHEAKGRLYCAKNAYMSRDLFASGYPKLNAFLAYRDPGICSGLSRRLIGDE